MANLKLCSLQFFILVITIAPHVITARNLHVHKLSQFQFPQTLEGSSKGNNVKGIHDVKLYLQRYGYLTNVATNNPDAFDDKLESAIATYQKFYNLNVSGMLDKETLTLMSQPRCGVPDIITNEMKNISNNNNNNNNDFHSHFTLFPGNPKWPVSKYHLTYSFLNNYPESFKAPVVSAMEKWASVSKFTFAPSGSWFGIADVQLSFERGSHGDRFPFDGKGGALAHAFGPLDGRVHFDGDDSFVVGNVSGSYNIELAALHELGHVLGLGHSKVEDAVMFASILPGTSKNLHFDDIEGIQTIYS